jgi:hypothetical protein
MTHSLISANGQERTGTNVSIDLTEMVVMMEDSITGDFLEFEMDTIDRIEIEETPEIIHHSGTVGGPDDA